MATTLPPGSPPSRTSRMAILANRVGLATLLLPLAAVLLMFAGRAACQWSVMVLGMSLYASLGAIALGLAARLRIRWIDHLQGEEEARGGYRKGFGALLLTVLLVVLSPAGRRDPCGGRSIFVNETSAIGSLREIDSACFTHALTHPKQGFPRRLAQVGPLPSGEKEGPEYAGLIDSSLVSGRKSGYQFTYTPGAPDEQGRIVSYAVRARPISFEVSGRRSFFADESGVIRFTADDRAATAQDPPLE